MISGALPISNAFGLLSTGRERSTTAVTYLFFSPEAGLGERDQDAHKYARRYLARPEAHVVGVTGQRRRASHSSTRSTIPCPGSSSPACS